MKRVRRREEASDDARARALLDKSGVGEEGGVKSVCYVLALSAYTPCIHVVCIKSLYSIYTCRVQATRSATR